MCSVDKSKYVVLDVETNGLSSLKHDLLSISIYKPDDKKEYNRFLPLELNDFVETTYINGITDEDLEDKTPLTQSEFDNLLNVFELDKRTILVFGSIDEKFMKNYMKRKGLKGFEKLIFYNFKHDIISSSFSSGEVSKDNLCMMYGIDGIQKIHSGINDCILEWKLFERMNNKKLIVLYNGVYELSDDYIVPVSYLSNYPNFKYMIDNLPLINYRSQIIKEFTITNSKIKKFETNISGIAIEHLINTMLDVVDKNEESFKFQYENKCKLKFVGHLNTNIHTIPIVTNSDGTLSALNDEDKQKVKEVNNVNIVLKKELKPLIDFIKHNIFEDNTIFSQELVVDYKDNVLAKCDLSSENAIMEIKTFNADLEKIKYQLYYQSKGRKIYLLHIKWDKKKRGLTFVVSKVDFVNEEQILLERKYRQLLNKEINLNKKIKKLQDDIANKDIIIKDFINMSTPATVRCKKCNHEWSINYKKLFENPVCPKCEPHKFLNDVEKKNLKNKKEKIDYGKKLYDDVFNKSNGKIYVLKYYGSKSNAEVGCSVCNHIWKIRPDHLLKRCYCPKCRNNK
ncbi:MAG: hypothetical protein IJ134_04300 [Bacilli bacterium]|nr:hypothetical protein [Bacilli bacterium]